MKCLSRKPVFKVSFIIISAFAFLLIFQFSYSNSHEKLSIVDRILEQYNKERSKANSLDQEIKECLEKGEEVSSVFHFAVAGQMLLVNGDIKKGIKVLNKAAAIDSNADAPHFLLAQAYYHLAIYDMLRKGLYKINVVSRTDMSLVDFCDGYLGIDIMELIALEGRPHSYGKALALKGIDKDERMRVFFYWLFLTKNKAIPDAQEAVEKAIKDFGLPKVLPVPTFWPDKETIGILKLAKKEMMLGKKGRGMKTPPGFMVIEKEKMKSLSKRINQLLPEPEKKDVNSDAAPVKNSIVYFINLAKAYRKAKKFDEATKILDEALEKLSKKEDRIKLQIELANVHYWWAKHLEKKSDRVNAIKHYEIAYIIDKVHRPRYSAIELSDIGFLYNAMGHNHKALPYFLEALPILQIVGDRASEANILNNIGVVNNNFGQNRKAIEYYEKALAIWQAVGDRAGEAQTFNNIGRVYSDLGQKEKAMEYYKKALSIWQAVGDQDGEATTLTNIGGIYSDLGKMHKALEYYKKALPIWQAVGNRFGKATILNNMGGVYDTLGKMHKALGYYEKALTIRQVLGDRAGEAATLNNIGGVYDALGQMHKALGYYEEALPIWQTVGDRTGETITLNHIRGVYDALGQMHKALEYYEKVLTIRQPAGNRVGEARTPNDNGLVYSTHGNWKKILEYYEKAFSIRQRVGDRTGEAAMLNNIGRVYDDSGDKHKALKYFQKALQICQAIGEKYGEALTMNDIGLVYFALGEHHEALEHYQKSLPIWRALGTRKGEVGTLNNIGGLYFSLGIRHRALEYYNKALPINRVVGDRAGEATTLNNIGSVYDGFGEKYKALEYYQKTLSIWRALGNRPKEATTLNNIGKLYSTINQEQKAIEYYEKSLRITRLVGNRPGEATTLNNIGLSYYDLGRMNKAIEYYQKALTIMQKVGSRKGESTILNSLGGVYSALGENHEALKYFEEALKISRGVGNRVSEAYTLDNTGTVYYNLGKKYKALEYYKRALPLKQAVGDLPGEATTFSHLMSLWESLEQIRLSIFYGKHSVNIYQRLRANIYGFEKRYQKSYLESKIDKYRKLAELLIIEGRLSEAQQVLEMLKEEEFFEFIRRDSSSAVTLSSQVDFTEFEKKWIEKYNTVMKKLSTISNEYNVLKFTRNKKEAEIKRLQEFNLKLKEAQKGYEEFLIQLKVTFDKHEKEMKDKPDTTILAKKARELQNTLKYLDETEGGKNAALHYLVYGEHISVILTTPSSQSVKQTEVDEKEFNVMIMNYRSLIVELGELMRGVDLVKKPNNILEGLIQKKKEYERKLYDVIFKPVDAELIKYGATNLMISLDGVLRYIPLAALWDGETYLVQRYRIALITPSSLRNIKDEPVEEKKILGLGASRGGQGFAPLPYVRREIRSIVKDDKKGYEGLINGRAFIDDDFTKDTMINQLKNKTYPLVHISSHFKFSPGDETKNHLLLGDGTIMKLSEIRRMGKLFDNVKLLVLSACQTGVGGNGEEIDGFGELAQQSGATSVIASLWPVADESTKDLMVAFYRILKQGKVTSKIEALRQAQLELAGLDDLLQKGKNKTPHSVRQKTKYSHPYYWGPFIMIGNWR